MKWTEAVSLSAIGVAERNCGDNHRNPWKICAWTSKKNKRIIRVFTGRRMKSVRRKSTTSVQRANKFTDWYPVQEHEAMLYLAVKLDLKDDEIRFRPRKKKNRKKKQA